MKHRDMTGSVSDERQCDTQQKKATKHSVQAMVSAVRPEWLRRGTSLPLRSIDRIGPALALIVVIHSPV